MRHLTRTLTLVCLVGLVPAGAWGQGPIIGIKGGLNVSTLRIDNPANPDLQIESQTSGVVGAFIYCGGGGWFGLQGEVTYSRNGAKVQDQAGATTLDLDYLRVPILLMASITSLKSPITPMLYAGPQVSFEMRCQIAQDGGEPVSCDSSQLSDSLQTNNVEFGLVFGGGVKAPIGRLAMHIDLRYNLGLSNVNGGTTSSTITVNNRGWSLMFGLGLPFG